MGEAHGVGIAPEREERFRIGGTERAQQEAGCFQSHHGRRIWKAVLVPRSKPTRS